LDADRGSNCEAETHPPLIDRHRYPIYEKMVEYDIPAMIHVSTSCNRCSQTTGAHYKDFPVKPERRL